MEDTPTIQEPESDWKYQDPSDDPGRKGLLLSNEIEKLCKRGILIRLEDYDEQHLRPASYTLTIGQDYVDSSGVIRSMNTEKPFFYMEPNSIVYVSTQEELNLPFYIAARFNLRVKWVYKGILLGTGPQVEPGFTGKLSCPLFNLTNRAIKIKLHEEFATIDFERTTDFCKGHSLTEIRNNKDLAREENGELIENLDQIRFGKERFLLFRQKRFPALKHLPDHDVISSLVQLADEVKTWRAIGIGTVIAFVGLALTLLNFQNNLYRELQVTSRQVTTLQEQLDIQKLELQNGRETSTGAHTAPAQGPTPTPTPNPAHGKKSPKVTIPRK